MEKPYFEVYGCYEMGDISEIREFFNTLNEASEFAKNNLEHYAIYMKMKIEEKRRF